MITISIRLDVLYPMWSALRGRQSDRLLILRFSDADIIWSGCHDAMVDHLISRDLVRPGEICD
jgi:hypothetical protein